MNKLGKSLTQALCRAPIAPVAVPKRTWAQVGHVICVPPRNKVTYGEVILHGLFMITVWYAPIAYFHTQLKVWRRKYIET